VAQTQIQPSDRDKSALVEKLKGYLQRLQNLLETILYGDTDKIDIGKETIETFKRDLTDIAKGINGLRTVQHLLQALPWVDSLSGSIEGARNELRVIGILLTQSQNEKIVRARLKSYDKCQECLTEAISQLSKLTDPLTKRPSRGI
jgi:type IV secretory pathway VirB4 component